MSIASIVVELGPVLLVVLGVMTVSLTALALDTTAVVLKVVKSSAASTGLPRPIPEGSTGIALVAEESLLSPRP